MRIGFSTGFMYKTINPISKKALDICRSVSTEAIEINCIGGLSENGEMVTNINSQDLSDFDYVSLHAPSKIRYVDDRSTRRLLAEIKSVCRTMPVDVVVFHPDLVDCWEVFSEFDIPYGFENMDHRKKFGKSVVDLQHVFSCCDAKFILDLNHCYSIDPTMALAQGFFENFGDRLHEIHLSGFTTYHDLLYETLQDGIMDAIPKRDVPIILESGCKCMVDVQREYDYVSAYINKK